MTALRTLYALRSVLRSTYFGVVLFTLAIGMAVWAADNSTLPVSGGGTEVFANKDIGGVKFPKHIPYDSSGAELFASGNAGYVRFPSAQTVTGAGGTFPSTQSGTWTVQPGNTANTTPWLASISAGGNTAAVKAASTAPAATDPALVVAISPNSVNANGQATMANSAPVVIASNQSAVPVSGASGAFASGSFASGSHASGSFASGAFASGSVASGALASGSIASGAMVDLGAQADSACSTDNGTCSAIALIKRTNQRLTTVNTSIGAANAYETVAASQTGQSLGATGATGDYLSHCVIYPVTTSPGVVTVFDNTNAAGSNAIAFAGGATSVSNLAPIAVPVGAISTAGAWKVTTGANVIVTCYGRFT